MKNTRHYDPFKELGVIVAEGEDDIALQQKIKTAYRERIIKRHPDKSSLSDEEKKQYPKQYLCFSPPDADCINDIICGSRVVFEKNARGEWLIHACADQPSYVNLALESKEGAFLQGLVPSTLPERCQVDQAPLIVAQDPEQQQLEAIMKCRKICTLDSFKEKPLERGSHKQTVSSDPRAAQYPVQCFYFSTLHPKYIPRIKNGACILFEQDSLKNWSIHACVKDAAYACSELTSDEQKFLESLVPDESRLTQYELNPTSEQQKTLDMIMRDRGVCTRGALYPRFLEETGMHFNRVRTIYNLLQDPLTRTLYHRIEVIHQAALTHHQNNLKIRDQLVGAKVLLLMWVQDFMMLPERLFPSTRSRCCVEAVNFLYTFLRYVIENYGEKTPLSKLSESVCSTFFTQSESPDSPAFMGFVGLSLLLIAMQTYDDFLTKFVYLHLELGKKTLSSLTRLTSSQKAMMQRCLVGIDDMPVVALPAIIFHLLLVNAAQQRRPHNLFTEWLELQQKYLEQQKISYFTDLHGLIIKFLEHDETSPDSKMPSLQEQYKDYTKRVKRVVSVLKIKKNKLSQSKPYQVTFNAKDFDKTLQHNAERIRLIGDSRQVDMFPAIVIEFLLHEFIHLLEMRTTIYLTVCQHSSRQSLEQQNVVDNIHKRAVTLETRLAAVSHLLSVLTLKQLLLELSGQKAQTGLTAEEFIIEGTENEIYQAKENLKLLYQQIKEDASLDKNRSSYESMCLLLLTNDQSRKAIDFLAPEQCKEVDQGIFMAYQYGKSFKLNLSYLGWLSMRIHIKIRTLFVLNMFCMSKQPDVPNITKHLKDYLDDVQRGNVHPETSNSLLQRSTLTLDLDVDQRKQFLDMQDELLSDAILYSRDDRLFASVSRLEKIIHRCYQYTDDKNIMERLARYREDIKKTQETLEHIKSQVRESPYATWIQIIRRLSPDKRKQFLSFCYAHTHTNDQIPKTGPLTLLITALRLMPTVIIETPLIPSNAPPPSETVELERLSPEYCQSLEAYLMLLSCLNQARDQEVEFLKSKLDLLEQEYRLQRYHAMSTHYETWRQRTVQCYSTLSGNIKGFSKNRLSLHSRVSDLTQKVELYKQETVYQKNLDSLDALRRECASVLSIVGGLEPALKKCREQCVSIQARLSDLERYVSDIPILFLSLSGTPNVSYSVETIRSQLENALIKMAVAAKLPEPEIKQTGLPTDVAIQRLTADFNQENRHFLALQKKVRTFDDQLKRLNTWVHEARQFKREQYRDYNEAKPAFDAVCFTLESILNFYGTLCNCVDYRQHTTATALWEALKQQEVEAMWEKITVHLDKPDKDRFDCMALIKYKKQKVDVLCEKIQVLDRELTTESGEDITRRHQQITTTTTTTFDQLTRWIADFTDDYRRRCKTLLDDTSAFLVDFLKHDFKAALKDNKIDFIMPSFRERYQTLKGEYDALECLTDWYQSYGISISGESQTLQDIVKRMACNKDALDSVEILLQTEEKMLDVYSASQKKRNQPKSGMPPVPEAVEALFRSAKASETSHIAKKEEPPTDDNTAAEEHPSVLHDLSEITSLLDAVMTEASLSDLPALARLENCFPKIASMVMEIKALNDEILKTNAQIMTLHLKMAKIKSVMSTDLYKVPKRCGSDRLLLLLKKRIADTTQDIKPCKAAVEKARIEMSHLIAILLHAALNDLRKSYPQVVENQGLLDEVVQHITFCRCNDLVLSFYPEEDTALFQLSVSEEQIPLTIRPASTVPQAIAQLYLAVQSQQQLDHGLSYLENVRYVLDQTRQFLKNSPVSKEELYQDALKEILKMTVKAQEKVATLESTFNCSAGDARIQDSHLHQPMGRAALQEIIKICHQLRGSLDALKVRFQDMPMLALHLNRLHVEPFIELLSNQIHEMTRIVPSTATAWYYTTPMPLPSSVVVCAPSQYLCGLFRPPLALPPTHPGGPGHAYSYGSPFAI